MSRAAEGLPRPLEQYRDCLRILARMNLHPDSRSELDSSDIVQQTLLKAHENIQGFRGRTDAELQAWLRAILSQQLAILARQRGRRKIRARSLETATGRLARRPAQSPSTPFLMPAHRPRGL
jgi:RNA polymerase sigma-70 factor, ECF subfamily